MIETSSLVQENDDYEGKRFEAEDQVLDLIDLREIS